MKRLILAIASMLAVSMLAGSTQVMAAPDAPDMFGAIHPPPLPNVQKCFQAVSGSDLQVFIDGCKTKLNPPGFPAMYFSGGFGLRTLTAFDQSKFQGIYVEDARMFGRIVGTEIVVYEDCMNERQEEDGGFWWPAAEEFNTAHQWPCLFEHTNSQDDDWDFEMYLTYRRILYPGPHLAAPETLKLTVKNADGP
ncbi:hypothetical protein [Micromonospora sediminicola]|uniref:hypothetical protein n=1 Tax=Micromonospora sediminicola TaxID=946078 RepID=UPI00379074FD